MKGMFFMQGIRGAITVENDNREEIIEAVKKLLINILEANDINAEDIGAALFSATKDLSRVYFLLLLHVNYLIGI